MTQICDLCGGRELDLAYEPEGTRRGLKVHACRGCGLLQSLPRHDRAAREGANISAGADWGNLRYGKGFRVGAHMSTLKACAWPAGTLKILDVGANRGAFIDAALAAWDNASIVAVEPDERVTGGYATRPNVALVPHRIEDCAFAEGSFDLIYSSHTLEHVASARRVLMQHALVLKPRGLMLLEVPNNAVLASADIVEEWFIDKHLYHYSPVTLRALLATAGFEIIEGPAANDREYLTVLARPGAWTMSETTVDSAEYERSMALVSAYRAARARNIAALRSAAQAIMSDPGRVVIWGAGRLFDALVREGGLDPRILAGLIDEGLLTHTKERHGVPLLPADALARLNADFVVVASRSFASEIATKAAALAPRARIVTFTELIDRAQRSAA